MDAYKIQLTNGRTTQLLVSTTQGDLEDNLVEEMAREDGLIQEDEVVEKIEMICDKEFTVISLEEGSIMIDYVFAREGINAFAKVVAEAGVSREFVVAIEGHHNEDNGLTFPGDSVVDGQTIADQPEVFGAAESDEG
jgi:hypothetical protein